MRARWLTVLVTAALLVLTPLAFEHRPTAPAAVQAAELLARVQASRAVGWSGTVQSQGSLPLPDSASFANLADLLGKDNDLRVWWRAADDWRVDRVRSTGEADLYRHGEQSARWVFESETATWAPVSTVRLPDASDLLPATLGRSMLQGARPAEVSRLPTRRVAGVDAPGLRLVPDDPVTTVDHVDLWAEPGTGLPLRVDLYGRGDRRPVLTTAVTSLQLGVPPERTTELRPPAGVTVNYDQSVDVAAAANAYAPYDLPVSLAGLSTRNGIDPGAVGIYGRGATTLFVLPLRGQVAEPLRERLQTGGGASATPVGTLAAVGPVGLLITRDRGQGSLLLTGTVTGATLQRAARQLLGRG